MSSRETHSADVWAQLVAAGHVFKVAQLGPGYLFLDDPIDLAPCDAVLSFRIDASLSVRQLKLPFGVRADECKTIVAAANPTERAAG
ncbi:MAG TPA: hypothetical protein VHR72_08790 [Gemmataceae bacterium]|nr:hypothetical protein [Gemmataceae bacterium]